MSGPLTRRTIVISSLATIGLSKAASAKVWRVALVTSGRGIPILDIIRASLNGAGYEEGKNLIIDFREANGRYGTLPALLDQLIALKPDIIIAEATPAGRIPRWEHEHLLEAVQQRLDANPQAMRQRRETVEHPFGTMKARMGATHFLTKTLQK